MRAALTKVLPCALLATACGSGDPPSEASEPSAPVEAGVEGDATIPAQDAAVPGDDTGTPACSEGPGGPPPYCPPPTTIGCEQGLAQACSTVFPACAPTWSADACTFPGAACSGLLATSTGPDSPLDAFCMYDSTSLQLVAYAFFTVDTGSLCPLGNVTVPVSCMNAWASTTPAGCLPYGQPRPWYCQTLPGQSDEGFPCMSSSECNYDGGACVFASGAVCGTPGVCGLGPAAGGPCPADAGNLDASDAEAVDASEDGE